MNTNDKQMHVVLHSFYKYKPQSKLPKFLLEKRGEKRQICTLYTILTHFRSIITEQKLYDSTNPSCVRCDPAMEEALDMSCFHTSELRSTILDHLYKVSDPAPRLLINGEVMELTPSGYTAGPVKRGATNTPIWTPTNDLTKLIQVIPGTSKISTASATISPLVTEQAHSNISRSLPTTGTTSVTIESAPSISHSPTTSMKNVPPPPPPRISSATTMKTVQNPSGITQGRATTIQNQPVTNYIKTLARPAESIYTDGEARFYPNPELLEIVRKMMKEHATTPKNENQYLYSYYDIVTAVSDYIIKYRYRLVDHRNIRVVDLKNDKLGVALQVNMLHRSQVQELVKNNIYHAKPEQRICHDAQIKHMEESIKKRKLTDNEGNTSKCGKCPKVDSDARIDAFVDHDTIVQKVKGIIQDSRINALNNDKEELKRMRQKIRLVCDGKNDEDLIKQEQQENEEEIINEEVKPKKTGSVFEKVKSIVKPRKQEEWTSTAKVEKDGPITRARKMLDCNKKNLTI